MGICFTVTAVEDNSSLEDYHSIYRKATCLKSLIL